MLLGLSWDCPSQSRQLAPYTSFQRVFSQGGHSFTFAEGTAESWEPTVEDRQVRK